MKLGSDEILIVVLGAFLGSGVSVGCSHAARPATQPVLQPDERPPLPPASGTPIGHLVDSASELTLSDDQVGKLRAIDDHLAAQLAADDSEMRPDPVPKPSAHEDKPRGLGVRAGGRGAGSMATGVESFPNAPAGSTPGNRPSSEQANIPASTVNHVSQQRAHHVRDAIQRALGLLDPAQQVIARRILTEHGVDPDTGEVSGGDPVAKPEDPKLNQPLPREP